MSEPDTDKYLYILSIDIGIINLGFILLECNKDYTLHDIVWFDLINITTFNHLDKESEKKCKLLHTKTFSDWLSHIFYLHRELFELCTHILIERQPPNGHVAVEQLLYFNFRNKAILIHPRSVHSFMGWKQEDYEQRKEKSIQSLHYRIIRSERTYLLDEFNKYDRKHDISDAYIQALYFLSEKYINYKLLKRNEDCISSLELDKFRFIKKLDEEL
jgi:hypothetical protein